MMNDEKKKGATTNGKVIERSQNADGYINRPFGSAQGPSERLNDKSDNFNLGLGPRRFTALRGRLLIE